MTATLNSLIESGITAQQSGQPDEAIACYQSALALAAGDAEVLSLLGLALTQANRLEEAEPLLRDAVAQEPDQPGFRMNLVELLTRKAMLEDAKKEVMWIVSRNPGFSPGWEKLGDIALLQEDKLKAKEDFKKAFSTAAVNFNIGLKLLGIHMALQEFDQALLILNSIADQGPDNPSLLNFACLANIAIQDWLQLESVSLNWTRVCPNEPVAWQMLCSALMEQGRYRLAEEYYRNVLANRPENAEDLSVYGQICLQCFKYDQAKNAFDRAEVLEPGRPDLLVSISLLHTYFGEFKQAEDYSRRAIQLAPFFAPAYTQLGHLTRGHFSDAEMDCLLGLKSETKQAAEHRIDIAFTLGRAYETKKNYKSAFEAYEFANQLNQEQSNEKKLRYDKSESCARTKAITTLFSTDIIQQALGEASPCPIFIVGMPRSGTTLIESTIAAHSRVFAGGERHLFPHMHNAALSFSLDKDKRLPPRSTLEEWARSYLSDLPDIGSANYFTDKNPINIEAVGLIAVLFPNAAIVHIRRNPVETCFSIFKHKFSRLWTFSHSLSDIAHFYGQYARLVSHWQRLLGRRFLTIQYEEFATNFAVMAPDLIKHCGLEWESQCLDFQKKNRAISTLSAVQVREPVKASPAVASFYQEFTGQLIEELNTAGVNLETGALLEAGSRQ